MMKEVFDVAFHEANTNADVKAVVLTGTGKYYCAGVDLAATIRPMMPRTLHEDIRRSNRALFDHFLDLQKPILVALNGPAVGASVTSAALCDGIIAAPHATLSTPFARLGVPPEGCSSVHFANIMGEEAAARMLGAEGWQPTAEEARAVGLVEDVVDSTDDLLPAAQRSAPSFLFCLPF